MRRYLERYVRGKRTIWWRIRKRKRKEKEERKSKEEEKKQCVGKKKRERHFPSRSPTNRQSKLVRARGKVSLCDTAYLWVPKFEFFIEVSKGRGFLLLRFLFT